LPRHSALYFVAAPAQKLLGQKPERKTPFPFSKKKFTPRQIRNARSVFLSGLPPYSAAGGSPARSERAWRVQATTRSARGNQSSGLLSKYIRTLYNRDRKNSDSVSETPKEPPRSGGAFAFPPQNPDSARIRHAPRGSSFANANSEMI